MTEIKASFKRRSDLIFFRRKSTISVLVCTDYKTLFVSCIYFDMFDLCDQLTIL